VRAVTLLSAHHRLRLEGANQSDYSAAAAVCFFAFDLEGSLRALLSEAFFRCKYALCRLRLALTRCCCPIERFYRSEQSGAQSGFGSKRIFMATLINRIAAQFDLLTNAVGALCL
jgi:hypothetical protein